VTHSLHRQGDRESLKRDYVILITPAIGVNDEGSGEKLARSLDILLEEGVTNIGDVEHGSVLGGLHPGDLRAYMGDGKRIRACVSDREALRRVLERLKEAGLGLSVTVSGLIDEVFDVSREIGVEPHTINLALGVWGRTELLPEPRVLEVTTMCGHHMISKDLAADAMERVKSGATSPEEAAEEIGRLCVCGIFNQKRCGEIFEKLKK
jgi:hypothetical protein